VAWALAAAAAAAVIAVGGCSSSRFLRFPHGGRKIEALRRPSRERSDMARARTTASPALADKPKTARAARGACYRHTLTSGLFGLPAGAKSVDWMILSHATHAETFRVTVYRVGVGPKTPVAPGALTLSLDPDEATHNANNVGPGKPFVPGFYYELVVETNSRAILPSVHVWQDHGNTVIPGTLIPPGSFVEL
jgi:hypothetical protein